MFILKNPALFPAIRRLSKPLTATLSKDGANGQADAVQGACPGEFIRRIAWPLALLAACPVMADQAMRLGGEVTAGYDSNPAQSHDGPELAFAQYAFDAARQTRLGESDLTVGVSGRYRDYEAANDNYRLTLHADWAHETAQGAGLVTLSVAGAAYRDALVPADERDEAALAVRYHHTLTARDTLGLIGEVRRLAYRNPSLPWAGRPGSGFDVQSSGRSARGRGVAVRRDDWLSGLELDATHHWSPTLSTLFSLVAARRDSPVPVDAYDRHGVGLLVRVEPMAAWRLEMGLGWSRTRYDQAPRQLERDDIQRTAGLALRRTLGPREIFCGVDWLDSDSTISERSFQQRVTQCGLAWSF